MRRIKRILTILILSLSSCGLNSTVDKAGDRGEALISHTAQEVRQLKDELKTDIAQLKTESIQEIERAIQETTPKVVEAALNTEAVAFLIVSLTCLLGFVVVVLGIILLRGVWRLLR